MKRKHIAANITTAELWTGPAPHPVPKPKSGSPQWAGLQYERKFGEYLKALFNDAVMLGQWFRYEEAGRSGYCQPDAILVPNDPSHPIIVFECKLTYRSIQAARQLRTLYKPVVEITWSRPTVLVQVCKYLTPAARRQKILTGVGQLLTPMLEAPPPQPAPSKKPVPVLLLNWRPH